MIKKSFEIKKLSEKKNIFLIYGENEGLKEEVIHDIGVKYSIENTYRYSEKDIFNNLNG